MLLEPIGDAPLADDMASRITITPREAAALDRLMDAYVGNDDGDPGMDDLRTLQRKVRRLAQDHTAYDTAHGTLDPAAYGVVDDGRTVQRRRDGTT